MPDAPPALSIEELTALRDECFADDIEITERMTHWSPERARAFFESGGVEEAAAPAPEAAPVLATGHHHPYSSPPVSPTRLGAKGFKTIKLFGDSHVNTFISIETSAGGVARR